MEQAALTARVGDPALYQQEPEQARALATRMAKIEEELVDLLERWEELESRSSNRN